MSGRRVTRGDPAFLGARFDGTGVDFALFSQHATRVELCLFDGPAASVEAERLPLEKSANVWTARVDGLRPGQLYGYRVHGPWAPAQGHRFNPAKVLFDPYGRAVGRTLRWADELFGYPVGGDPDVPDPRDDAPFAPLAAVAESWFDWGGDRPPRVPWRDTVVYEAHVQGFTKLHPGVPEALRGTYAGLASPAALKHLKGLGVTAVELLPVHHHVDDRHLLEKGLTNHWGYNTLGFFAPEPAYAAGGLPGAVAEFKEMVRALHAAGLEVLLDVVYNHTCEGSHLGPTLSLRGADNACYYRLSPEDPRYCLDVTGCGNTLDTANPWALQLVMDSLRYWVTEMHVDGFRFDLAVALGRERHAFDRDGSFFDAVHQDPVLRGVKLIAEPWDVGEGGYQAGGFPVRWAEWNGKYRDAARRFWKSDEGVLPELATRLAGSSDHFALSGRGPWASVNFVTSHDGFTLADLTAYDRKHNEANLEENRDGEENNLSWNCGAEGPDAPKKVLALRERQRRNLLATLAFSQGTPMLRAGDELVHTQQGNNNAYCQENALSWLDWRETPEKRAFLEFTRRVLALRREHPVFRRERFLEGAPPPGGTAKDVAWLAPDGAEIPDGAWTRPGARAVGMLLSGEGAEPGERADSVLVLLSAAPKAGPFVLPPVPGGARWERLLVTGSFRGPRLFAPGARFPLAARSLAVLRAAP